MCHNLRDYSEIDSQSGIVTILWWMEFKCGCDKEGMPQFTIFHAMKPCLHTHWQLPNLLLRANIPTSSDQGKQFSYVCVLHA